MYYKWGDTLSRSRASIIAVISIRGYGKTYGMRKTAINGFIKHGTRYVEVVRYKAELKDFKAEYFDKFVANNEFPGYMFKVKGNAGYIAKAVEDEDKAEWSEMVYFVPLSQQHKMKTRTFANVKYIIFDEFLIPRHKFPGYLPNEYGELLNLMDTVIREVPGEGTKVKTVLLGNSEGILYNPYFAAWGINGEPDFGYSWHKGKDVLLHYVEPGEYAERKADTLVGRLAEGTSVSNVMSSNTFVDANDDFIERKPKNASFSFGLVYRGRAFGIWLDEIEGYYYVSNKLPKDAQPVYALTTDDNRINYVMMDRADARLKAFSKLYYYGCIRYEDHSIRSEFTKLLNLLGVR